MNWTDTRTALIDAGVDANQLPEKWEPGADLRGANLSGADLSGADLRGANLSGADLRGADLRGATGPITTGSFGRHTAIAAGGYISIGCEWHTYAVWLADYEKIGRHHEYSTDEIADYGAWIRLAVARQLRIESTNPDGRQPPEEGAA